MQNFGAPLPAAGGGTGVSTAPANQVFAGPPSGGAAAPAFRPLVSADIPAAEINVTGASVSDFSANGTYILFASATFTAVCTRLSARGTCYLNHQTTTATPFVAYVDVYDNTAGSQLVRGPTAYLYLNSGTAPIGSLYPIVGSSALIVGRSYTVRLYIQRGTANGPTAVSTPYIEASHY